MRRLPKTTREAVDFIAIIVIDVVVLALAIWLAHKHR